MSASTFELLKAVRDRLVADNGTGGLFFSTSTVNQLITNVYSVRAPQATPSGAGAMEPYILLVPVANVEETMFTTATYGVQHQVQVSIFTPLGGGLDPGEKIAARVRARLNRWQPTITGWAPSQMLRQGSQGPFEDEGNYHHVEEYSAYMAKA